ncbi:MAG: thymidine phosphorylase, partial [Eubacteriales bacterium]|nr:thymidine phosphorylase [Eubacteriales bacterium]
MNVTDIINKKKKKQELSCAEIEYIVNGYTQDLIPDYQMAAFLMAVWFSGMSGRETGDYTHALVNTGERIDLSGISGRKVDKHSTGGVGDKVTLIALPLAALSGAKVAKMSGRGLGHTGGTIDKLESIPGFRTALTQKEFCGILEKNGLAITSQTSSLTPGDSKIYALRDVTATVDSIPLIAASIMSKKIASGADCLVLDVKAGSGAFMKTQADARRLAEEMLKIAGLSGIKATAVISSMDQPL